MQYVLKERIGLPDLFCGREEEMKRLIDWTARIPKEISKSQAILGRRKSGKTAIMQRLFNILWNKKGVKMERCENGVGPYKPSNFHTCYAEY